MDTLLILDDEEKMLSLFQKTLSQQGYSTVLASDYTQFMEFLHSPKKIDLILLDYILPQKNGIQIIYELRKDKRFKKIPVIMITGIHDDDVNLKALEAGADDFITKPVNFSILKLRVNALITSRKYQDLKDNYQERLEKEISLETHKITRILEKQRMISNEIIDRLAMAAEYRDTDTGNHIIRMAEYSYMIARAARFNDEQAEVVKQASKMHDLGKIAIPDSILLKPGKLNDEEWSIMRTHTSIGAEMLSNSQIDNIQVAEVIARSHHEKWDGSGYPQGLSGENIPLEGRIVAIADVFDALTSVRPYKQPFSFDKSVEIIKKDAGTHFDPHLVHLFEENLAQIHEVYSLWQEKEEPYG